MRCGAVRYGPGMSRIASERLVAIGGSALIIMSVTVLGCQAQATTTDPPSTQVSVVPTPAPSLATPDPTPTASPIPTPGPTASPSASPVAPVADPLLGTDGRLTVLLLGTDYRPAHPGNRTDAMMVVSMDPTTGKSAAFSIPRDIAHFPLPKSGSYGPKINGLYQHLQSTMGNGGEGLKQAISRAFDIEVDRYVLIGFPGVIKLVRAVGGVDVTLKERYYDPYYWVNNHHRGWGLPAGTSHLDADDALIFARSRKGDSDFSRAKRQQQLVMAAVTKVRARGLDDLPKLLKIARDNVRTDLPLDRAADLFALYSTVDLTASERVVFAPTKFAVRAGGTDYRLVLDICRKWIATHFPPVRPFGAWPPS